MEKRSSRTKVPKYILFKFDIDQTTAIFSSNIVRGDFKENGVGEAPFKGDWFTGVFLKLAGKREIKLFRLK